MQINARAIQNADRPTFFTRTLARARASLAPQLGTGHCSRTWSRYCVIPYVHEEIGWRMGRSHGPVSLCLCARGEHHKASPRASPYTSVGRAGRGTCPYPPARPPDNYCLSSLLAVLVLVAFLPQPHLLTHTRRPLLSPSMDVVVLPADGDTPSLSPEEADLLGRDVRVDLP